MNNQKVSVMTTALSLLRSNRNLLLISLIWIVMWILPWGKLPTFQLNVYLAFLIDMMRLGIALGMFVVPGALLYILINRHDDIPSLIDIIVVGFAFSVVVIALIGLFGRVTGLSFRLVKVLFGLAGLIELLMLIVSEPDITLDKAEAILASLRSDLKTPGLVLALLLALLMTLNGYLFFYDDTTYLAYITNWQFSDHLGFKNIIFDGNFIESARFWLAMYPMGQALLSSLSGVPGILLLTNYLELLLVPGAVLTSYWFARALNLSRKVAGFAALIQVTLFSWMIWNLWPVGTWFFQSMSEDKVSAVFLLSPVFFVFVLRYIQAPRRRNLLLVLLSGLSLTLTHPVILFFSCVIAFLMGLVSWVVKKSTGRVILHLIVCCAILMLPYLVIRLAGGLSQTRIAYDAESASETFQVERYIRTISDVFYGLNPELLKLMNFEISSNDVIFQLFRWTPVFLIVIAGIWSMVNLKRGVLHWYVFACALLILFATLPYTGWLLGYFVSARLISRAAWFAPLGLSGVLLAMLITYWLKSRQIVDASGRINIFKRFNLGVEAIGLSLCFMFVAPVLLNSLVLQVPLFFKELEHSRQLAQVGAFIDQNTTYPVTAIALDYDDTQLLPGVSAHTVLISFREEVPVNPHNFFLPEQELQSRINASNVIRSLDKKMPDEEACYLLEKYSVKYVLAQPNNVEFFIENIKKCKSDTNVVFETANLVLVNLK